MSGMPRHKFRGTKRLRIEPALGHLQPDLSQKIPLLRSLDALSHDRSTFAEISDANFCNELLPPLTPMESTSRLSSFNTRSLATG